MAVREYKGKIAIRDERAEREKKTSRIMTHVFLLRRFFQDLDTGNVRS